MITFGGGSFTRAALYPYGTLHQTHSDILPCLFQKLLKLEMRSVELERGICPIAKSTLNELFL